MASFFDRIKDFVLDGGAAFNPSHSFSESAPTVEELLDEAQRLIQSCIHHDQVMIAKKHILETAQRYRTLRQFSQNDLIRVKALTEHLAYSRFCELGTL